VLSEQLILDRVSLPGDALNALVLGAEIFVENLSQGRLLDLNAVLDLQKFLQGLGVSEDNSRSKLAVELLCDRLPLQLHRFLLQVQLWEEFGVLLCLEDEVVDIALSNAVLSGDNFDWRLLNEYHVHNLNLLRKSDFLAATTSLSHAWRRRLLELNWIDSEWILLFACTAVPYLVNELLEITWLQA
jgi:hypothetical protein